MSRSFWSIRCAKSVSLLVVAFTLLRGGAQAQTPLDAGALIQQSRQHQLRSEPMPSFAPLQKTKLAVLVPLDVSNAVRIDRLQFEGNHALSNRELLDAFSDRVGQLLDYAAMKRLAMDVGEFYRVRGLWAKAILPPQRLDQGELLLHVYEGQLGKITLEVQTAEEAPSRLSPSMAKAFIQRAQQRAQANWGEQGEGEIFNIKAYQESIRRLNAVPGIQASGSLKSGEHIAQTDVNLRLSNTPLFSGRVGIDNAGSRSTGYVGVNASMNIDSPLSHGEQFTIAMGQTQGVSMFSGGASVLLNTWGSRLGLNLSDMRFSVCCGPLAESRATGHSTGAMFTLSHAFAMRDRWTSTGVLTYAYRSSLSASNAGVTSDKQQEVLTAQWQNAWPDRLGGLGAVNLASLNYTLGRMDLGVDPEVVTNALNDVAGIQGPYEKWQINVSRLQTLNKSTQLWASLLGQLALDNLDSSEKISLGGASSVRAYPTGEASGDSGAVASLELRHNLSASWQGRAFYDYGFILVNQDPWTGGNAVTSSLGNHYALRGAGLGAMWSGGQGAQFSATLARRFGANPAADAQGKDGDGTRRAWRLWLSASQAY